jgi:hypothetical protein
VFHTSASAQTPQFVTHRDYSSGYGSASIAAGDINGDTVPDLAIANYFDGTVAVLLGNAGGTFQPARVMYLGPGNSPRSAALGDFNRDGKPDLAVASPGANTVTVLLGVGDGTFQVAVVLGAGSSPGGVAVGDVNADGKPDLAVANAASNNVSVLIGNGDGTFQPARSFLADSGPAFVTFGDFNRDDKTDLAIANTGSGTVSVLLGDGDGNYEAPRTFAAGAGVWAVAVADFNGDGAPDLAAANNGANSVSMLLGNGDGTFQPKQTAAVTGTPSFVAAADFNRDGHSDLAVASSGSSIAWSPIHADPIFVKSATTIKTMAAAGGMADSDVASATYTIRVAPPALIPPGGRPLATLPAAEEGGQ